MILDSPIISGSSTVTGDLTVLGTLNASVSGSVTSASYATNAETLDGLDSTSFTTTSSFNTASGSFSTRVTNLETASGSFSTRVTSTEGSVSSLNSKSGSYATTGSNSFNGNQVITGSLTTTGTITAQTLNVQQVTSSIVYSSGSNIFGNSVSNTQQFTGSVSITGSLTSNGALTGTSATFSGVGVFGGAANIDNNLALQITSTGTTTQRWIGINKNNSYGLIIGYYENAAGLSGVGSYIRQVSSDPIFFLVNNTIEALRLTSTGAAVFSSGVTANNLIIKNTGVPAAQLYRDLDINSVGPAGQGIEFGARDGSTFIAGAAIYGALNNPSTTGRLDFQTLTSGSLTTKLVIDYTGLVGIGTTSPVRLLELYGPALTSDTPTLRISSADASGTRKFGIEFYSRTGADVRGKLLVDNNGRVYLDDNGGGGVVLQANGGSGNVGIGTTSPSYKLDVSGTGRFTGTITGGSNFELINAGGPYVLVGEGTGVNQYGVADWDATNNVLRIATQPYAFGANGGQLNLTTGGNVLINTTNTGASGLNINNAANVSFSEGSGESYANVFRQRNTAATVVSSGYKRSLTSSFASSFSSAMARAAIAVGYNNGSIAFFTDPSSTVANGTDIAPNERVTIVNNGNVGIGNTSPLTKLTVNNAVAGAILPYIQGTGLSYNNEGISVAGSNTNNTNIGNGLTLYNNVASVGAYGPVVAWSSMTVGGAYNATYAFITGEYRGAGGDNNWSRGDLIFGTGDTYGATERMRIKDSGNVGIGTTSPSAKLHVNGTLKVSDTFSWASGDGVNWYIQGQANGPTIRMKYDGGSTNRSGALGWVDNGGGRYETLTWQDQTAWFSGNVGISTTSPYAKLDVRGAIALGRTTDTYPKNVRLVKQGSTSITFTALTGTIGAWRPGHAFIKVSGGQNGLQEYWAAWFYVRIIAYFASSAIMTVVDSGGDTGAVTFSSSSDTNSPQTMNFILTDAGGTTDTMIADIDLTYHEGIISIS